MREHNFWKMLIFATLNKKKVIRAFKDLRWIAKTPTLQRMFLSIVRRWYRQDAQVELLKTYSCGFSSDKRVSDVSGIMLEVFWLSAEWKSFVVAAFAGDVELVFGHPVHRVGEKTAPRINRCTQR